MKLSHYIIYIAVEIVIYSSFNTSNREPASFILNERETRFASGMERDRSNLSRSIRHPAKKFSNLSPEILVEWIAPDVSLWRIKLQVSWTYHNVTERNDHVTRITREKPVNVSFDP